MKKLKRDKNFWEILFGHPECVGDIYFLNGKVDRDVGNKEWIRKAYGQNPYFIVREKGLKPTRDYDNAHIITKIILKCSSCLQKNCLRPLEKKKDGRICV